MHSTLFTWVALTVALTKRENRTLCQHYCAERQAKVKCIAGSGTGSRNTTWSQNLYTCMTQDWLQQHPEIQTINAGGASTVAIKQLISQINYSNTGRLYVTFKREAGVSNLAGLTWQETIRTLDRYNCNSLKAK